MVYSSLSGLVQGLQEVRKFIDEHSQVRSLPEQEIVVDGRNALLSRLESIAGAATFDVVTDEATLMPLAMYKNGTPLAKA